MCYKNLELNKHSHKNVILIKFENISNPMLYIK